MIIHHVRLQLTGGDPTVPGRRIGHSVRQRLTDRLEADHAQALSVSPGVCCTAETEATVTGDAEGHPDRMPLRPVHSYEELFRYHRAHEAVTQDQQCRVGGGLAISGLDSEAERPSRTPGSGHANAQEWYYHTYVDTGCAAIQCQTLADDTVTGLQVAGHDDGPRVTGIDTQAIDIDALDYSHLAAADTHVLTFTSPYVLDSAAPETDERALESWLRRPETLDRRSLTVAVDGERYECAASATGQHAVYDGTSPIAVAKMGILGMGLHAKYGFGGVRVWTPGDGRGAGQDTTAGNGDVR
jgi:hypothetical protein